MSSEINLRKAGPRDARSSPGQNGAYDANYRTLFENVKRAEARLAAQFAVTKVLAETDSIAQAAPQILQAFCETSGWQMGALWTVDATETELRCVAVWYQPAA